MLQSIRDRAQGIAVWLIVGLIIITFALFGLSSYLSGASKSVVASVNGEEITESDFIREYQNYQQRLQQILGKNYRPEMFQESVMKQRVLDGMIDRELISQSLEDDKFYVSPRLLVTALKKIEAFQDESGQFSSERYLQVLKSQRIRPELFEMQMMQDLANDYLRSGLERSAFVTARQAEQIEVLQKQQRRIGYFVLAAADYRKAITLSDDEIQAYYDKHKDEFRTPEKVSVDYVELKLEDVAKQIDIDDADIRAYYESHKSNYMTAGEKRRVRHILVLVDDKTDDAAAKARAEEILARLQKGENFETLARKESQDPGSAAQGGDLGLIGKGIMDKAFEDAAFALELNALSAPVRSKFGYHIIRVDEIQPQKVKPLAEVRDQIRRELQLEQAEERFYQDVDTLNNLSYEVPDTLEPIVDELGLKIKQSPLMSRGGGAGIFADRKLINAVFHDEVLNQGKNSEMIELSDTHMVVLRLREHQPSKPQTLEQIKPMITARLKNEKAMEQIRKDAEAALEKIKAGENPQAVATAHKQAWTDSVLVSRQPGKEDKLNPAIRKDVFSMARPEAGKPVYGMTFLPGGDIAIVALQEVIAGNSVDAAALKSMREQLAGMYGQEEFSAYISHLKDQAKITTNLKISDEDNP